MTKNYNVIIKDGETSRCVPLIEFAQEYLKDKKEEFDLNDCFKGDADEALIDLSCMFLVNEPTLRFYSKELIEEKVTQIALHIGTTKAFVKKQYKYAFSFFTKEGIYESVDWMHIENTPKLIFKNPYPGRKDGDHIFRFKGKEYQIVE